jgi:hypothetical protein
MGPRIGVILWWLFEPGRWDAAFSTWVIPVMGFIFLPWTTLMWVAVAPFGNAAGWDYFWLALAVLADIFSYTGGGYTNRNRIPGYPGYT